MLEYGQPMHAFDYSCISQNKIIVRTAADKESLHSLDGVLRPLDSSMLLITDPEKPVGIAGIMGGENSEITGATKTIVFESACFNGPLHSGVFQKARFANRGSLRFEKGLDPQNTMPALIRACELVEMLGGGEIVDGFIDINYTKAEKRTLTLDPRRRQPACSALRFPERKWRKR